jgi:HSP20 family molecular chaperone IbpA
MAREVSVFDLIESAALSGTEFMNNIFDKWSTPRQVRDLQVGVFPFANIFLDKSKSYVIQAALAGVPKEKLDLEFKNHYVYLKVDLEPQDGEVEKEKYVIQHGIKDFTFIENTWKIPEKFDIEKLEVSYVDGLLTIKAPLKQEEAALLEPRKLEIK